MVPTSGAVSGLQQKSFFNGGSSPTSFQQWQFPNILSAVAVPLVTVLSCNSVAPAVFAQWNLHLQGASPHQFSTPASPPRFFQGESPNQVSQPPSPVEFFQCASPNQFSSRHLPRTIPRHQSQPLLSLNFSKATKSKHKSHSYCHSELSPKLVPQTKPSHDSPPADPQITHSPPAEPTPYPCAPVCSEAVVRPQSNAQIPSSKSVTHPTPHVHHNPGAR